MTVKVSEQNCSKIVISPLAAFIADSRARAWLTLHMYGLPASCCILLFNILVFLYRISNISNFAMQLQPCILLVSAGTTDLQYYKCISLRHQLIPHTELTTAGYSFCLIRPN